MMPRAPVDSHPDLYPPLPLTSTTHDHSSVSHTAQGQPKSGYSQNEHRIGASLAHLKTQVFNMPRRASKFLGGLTLIRAPSGSNHLSSRSPAAAVVAQTGDESEPPSSTYVSLDHVLSPLELSNATALPKITFPVKDPLGLGIFDKIRTQSMSTKRNVNTRPRQEILKACCRYTCTQIGVTRLISLVVVRSRDLTQSRSAAEISRGNVITDNFNADCGNKAFEKQQAQQALGEAFRKVQDCLAPMGRDTLVISEILGWAQATPSFVAARRERYFPTAAKIGLPTLSLKKLIDVCQALQKQISSVEAELQHVAEGSLEGGEERLATIQCWRNLHEALKAYYVAQGVCQRARSNRSQIINETKSELSELLGHVLKASAVITTTIVSGGTSSSIVKILVSCADALGVKAGAHESRMQMLKGIQGYVKMQEKLAEARLVQQLASADGLEPEQRSAYLSIEKNCRTDASILWRTQVRSALILGGLKTLSLFSAAVTFVGLFSEPATFSAGFIANLIITAGSLSFKHLHLPHLDEEFQNHFPTTEEFNQAEKLKEYAVPTSDLEAYLSQKIKAREAILAVKFSEPRALAPVLKGAQKAVGMTRTHYHDNANQLTNAMQNLRDTDKRFERKTPREQWLQNADMKSLLINNELMQSEHEEYIKNALDMVELLNGADPKLAQKFFFELYKHPSNSVLDLRRSGWARAKNILVEKWQTPFMRADHASLSVLGARNYEIRVDLPKFVAFFATNRKFRNLASGVAGDLLKNQAAKQLKGQIDLGVMHLLINRNQSPNNLPRAVYRV